MAKADTAQSSFLHSERVDIAGGHLNNAQGNITNLTINYHPTDVRNLVPSIVEAHSPGTFRDFQASSISQRSNTVYERHLTTKRIGYPLWIPQPNRRLPLSYRRQGVSIGDVGILSKGGGFDFLFNILLPIGNPINPKQMPDNFLPLDPPLDDIDICEYCEFDEGSYLASGSVEHSHGKRSDSALSFKSCASDGAVVTMPYGANSQDVANVARMKEYAAKHAEDWYKFANGPRGREARNGDLRLVIGCDKTTAWGMATFQNVSQVEQCELKFFPSSLGPGDSNPTSFVKYLWEQSGHAEAKTGPTMKESTELKRGDSTMEPDELYENQCLFVRTLNIMLGKDIWAGLQHQTTVKVDDKPEESSGTRDLSAPSYSTRSIGTRLVMAVHKDNGPVDRDHLYEDHEEEDGDPSPGYDDAIIVTSSSLALDGHPSDAINQKLLDMNPDAKVAITSDNEWGHLQSSGPSDPEDPIAYQASLLSRITTSRNLLEPSGIVSLQLNESYIADLDDLLTCIRDGETTLEIFLFGGYENCFSIFRKIVDTLESHYLSNLPASDSSGTSSDQEPDSLSALLDLLKGLYSGLSTTRHPEITPGGGFTWEEGGEFTWEGAPWHEMYRRLSTLLLVASPDQEDLQLHLFRQLTYTLAQLFFSTGVYEFSTEAMLFHIAALSGAKRDRLLSSRLNLQLFFLLSRRYLMTRNLNDLQTAILFLKKQQLHCCHPSTPLNEDYGPRDLPVLPDLSAMVSAKIAAYGKHNIWPYPACSYIQAVLSRFSDEGTLMERGSPTPRDRSWDSWQEDVPESWSTTPALKSALMETGPSQASSISKTPHHTDDEQTRTVAIPDEAAGRWLTSLQFKSALMETGPSQSPSISKTPDHTEDKQARTTGEIQQSSRDRVRPSKETRKGAKPGPQPDESSLTSELERMGF